MARSKWLSLPVLPAIQEVPALPCQWLIYSCHFLRMGVCRNDKYYGEALNIITSGFARQTGSASIFMSRSDLFMPSFQEEGWFLGMTNTMVKFKLWTQHKSINYGQENAGASCLVSKTGSDDIWGFTIVFVNPRHPHVCSFVLNKSNDLEILKNWRRRYFKHSAKGPCFSKFSRA